MTGFRFPSSLSLSLYVIVLSIQPLGSAALQTTRGISRVMQSVSKLSMSPSNPWCPGTGRGCRDAELTPGQASGAVRISVLRSCSSSVCASLSLGTGESRVGRRMWFSGRRSMRSGLRTGEQGGESWKSLCWRMDRNEGWLRTGSEAGSHGNILF